jgi:hypothetical protein
MDIPLASTVAEACAIARTGKTVLYEAINSDRKAAHGGVAR